MLTDRALQTRELNAKKIGSYSDSARSCGGYSCLRRRSSDGVIFYDVPEKQISGNLKNLFRHSWLDKFYHTPVRQLSLGATDAGGHHAHCLHNPEYFVPG